MRRLLSLLLIVVFLAAPGLGEGFYWVVDEWADENVSFKDQARGIMLGMTLEEKVYQLFIVAPEDLTDEKQTTIWPGENPLLHYPVGGMVLYGRNIVSEEQVQALATEFFLDAAQAGVFTPFLAVDEEGGYVARMANKLGYPLTLTPEEMGKLGRPTLAKEAGERIGGYLVPLGINLNFAPVADVMVVDAPEIGNRSFGDDTDMVTQMALSMAEGLRQQGVIPCFKHFPGHGAVTGNTHQGKASTRRSLEQMEQAELIPFAIGADAEVEMIMISHFTAQALDSKYPCSLSANVINGLLRERLGYQGVVITDALRMDAITKYYDSDEAAVLAIQAGADILLLPNNFHKAVEGIFEALETGELTEKRINESVERILALKIQAGLIR